MIKSKLILIGVFIFFQTGAAIGQLTVLGSFNPSGASSLCGIGYDPDSSQVWVYGCSNSTIQCYDTTGALLNSFPVIGGTANDVDIEITPQPLMLHNSTIDKGKVLFINGETDAAEIYAIENGTGSVIDTLAANFGTDHVVGGGYHEQRNSFFLVQDNVPNTANENLIAEINPATGDTLQVFQITPYFNVSFGDLDIGANGNLFVVSSVEDSIAEFTTQGGFVQCHALPTGVSDLSGIAIDCNTGEAWVSKESGTVYRLGNFPCSTTNIFEGTHDAAIISEVTPNPFEDKFEFDISLPQAGYLNMSVFNLLGEEIINIYDGQATSGTKKFSIAAENFAKGVYMIKATGNGFVQTRLIVCAK